MDKRKPLVSVIIRTKDRPKLLKRALASISSQTYRPIEVVLVNDGGVSPDPAELRKILDNVSLTYVGLKRNTGRAHAANTGIRNTQGAYFCFLDDDDIFYPDHLASLVRSVERLDHKIVYTDAHIAYLDHENTDSDFAIKERRLFSSRDFSYEELVTDNYIPLLCILFSRDILKTVRGFDEKFDLYEDWDFLIRVSGKYPFYHIKKVTAEYLQWSRSAQIAHTPEYVGQARAAHSMIIQKHRRRFSPDMIRSLVEKRRKLSEQEFLVHSLSETKGAVEAKLQEQEAAVRALSETKGELEGRLQEQEAAVRALSEAKGKLERKLLQQESELTSFIIAKDKLEKGLQQQESELKSFHVAKSELERKLQEREWEIKSFIVSKSKLEQKLKQREGEVNELITLIKERERSLQEKDGALTKIYASRGWRFLLMYYRTRDALFPPQSRKRAFIKNLICVLSNISAAIRSFFKGERARENRKTGYDKVSEALHLPAGKRGTAGNSSPIEKKVLRNQRQGQKGSVLIAGIYLADRANCIEHIVRELGQSREHKVVQKWIALFGEPPSEEVAAVTIARHLEGAPKFVLLNRLLSAEPLDEYEYIIICDDDVLLPEGFVDRFLSRQEKYDFSLAQPARTHSSYTDWPFVEQIEGITARRTRFVEIGPVFSLRDELFSALIPFDESSFMGWGYDFVWPCIIEHQDLKMGIIDATPVEHSIRKPVEHYKYDEAQKSMELFLSTKQHLTKNDAFVILESYTE